MHLAILTSGRQDWGILRNVADALRESGIRLSLLVGGMHLSSHFGNTIDQVEQLGYEVSARIPWIADDGSTPPYVQAAGALEGVARALASVRPDALILLGDRFETASAAIAATIERIPVVHLHGGEETLGAIDNSLRHAISKLAHLHFVSHEDHRARLLLLGEDPKTIFVVGAPGLDNVWRSDVLDRRALETRLGIVLVPPVVIVTVHPATLATGSSVADVDAVVAAMDAIDATYVITLPNSDPGAEQIRSRLLSAAAHPRRKAFDALGEQAFWGLLRCADAMLGNSSSALIEAPAVKLPAVNVGCRQAGRLRGANVIDAASEQESVIAALHQALTGAFRSSLQNEESPFGDGHAGQRIARILKQWTPPKPPAKSPIKT